MAIRLIRLASAEWNQPPEAISKLFADYSVFQYIEECFGIFHVEGDKAILADIAEYLKNKGATDYAKADK